eukprot:6109624-Prymnesium_polylepis.1
MGTRQVLDGVGHEAYSCMVVAALAKARKGLAEESRTLDQLVRASQLQHRRALYMQRLVDVQRQLKAVLSTSDDRELRAGNAAAAVASAERALERIAPAWLKIRDLLAQTYFMPFALCHLALLSRAATLIAQLHAALLAAHSGVARGPPPILLKLHQPAGTSDSALSRAFGSEPTAVAMADPGLGCSAASSTLAPMSAELDDEDLGEVEDLGVAAAAPVTPVVDIAAARPGLEEAMDTADEVAAEPAETTKAMSAAGDHCAQEAEVEEAD